LNTLELMVERPEIGALAAALAPGELTLDGAAARPHPVRRTWVDTFDWRLLRAGLELQQVEANGATSLELRGHGEHDIGMPVMAIDWPADAESLPAGVLRDRVAALTGIRALVRTACFDGRRQTLRVLDDEGKTIARLHLDAPDGDGSPVRITVSPLRGYDREAARAAALLATTHGVDSTSVSCYQQCLATGGRSFDAALFAGPSVHPDMQASAAVAGVLRSFLATVEANVPGVLADFDSEVLHDLRVAVRRARATVKLAGDVLPAAHRDSPSTPSPVDRLATGLKWLGDATTPTRDLDVYLLEVPAMAGRLRAARAIDLEEFRTHLVGHRAVAQARLADDLRSARYGALVSLWREVAAEPPDTTPPGPTAAEFAAARLRRAHRRVVKLGSKITPFTPPGQLHELRKRCKELRYLLEIFEAVEPPPTRRRVLPVLKALQECLGEFQDSEVQAGAIRTFATEMMSSGTAGPQTLLAMGELAGQLDAGQERARVAFARTFAAFSAATRKLHWAAGVGAA
jgi:CHAD domain-containing protein